MRILKILLAVLLVTACSPAFADGESSTIDAINDLVEVSKCSGKSPEYGRPCEWKINIYGTWNGCTVSWLISTNDGTNKVPYKDITHVSGSSTEDDNFSASWGWSPLNTADQTILYASVSGCASAPSLTSNVFMVK